MSAALTCAGTALLAILLLAGAGEDPLAGTLALGLNLLAVAGLLAAISLAITGRALGFALGGLNRYSISRVQMGLWTVVVVGLLLTAAERNLLVAAAPDALNIALPGALLAAVGISFASGAAAPAIVALRGHATAEATPEQLAAAASRGGGPNRDPAGLTARGQVLGNQDAQDACWRDLFSGDEAAGFGRVDLSKVQQGLLTLVILGIYLVSCATHFTGTAAITELPIFGESSAQLLALSHGGYLAFKAVPKPDAGAPQAANRA
ncbi:hypothetical protein [Falsiroseomonas sp.]|uniref:hypothetical protein n=1 Tax=Falsiroseomonas sp. TaxID=2870721 RepID=UPI003F6E9B51